MQMQNIRNFSIIAHIDHGKSTLADRLIQTCEGLSKREMQEQVLDSMDLERERGITIKAQSVTLNYTANNGETYQLNFIDTPGHVDFSYEVSRSLSACEGALLVVDASQGVEAQSVANCYTAIEQGLEVLPVLNKIDLPAADPERVISEIEDVIGIEADHACRVSAKTGEGVDELLEQLITEVPPPEGDPEAPLQALIIDSWFDPYVGVVILVRVKQGQIRKRQKMLVMSTQRSYLIDDVGVFTPKRTSQDVLSAGQVGYIIGGIKEIDSARVGDTITLRAAPLELSFAEDGTYEDPRSRYQGREALFEGIRKFQEENPGARILITSGVDAHHGKIRFRWQMVGADGQLVTEGMDYGELAEDGRETEGRHMGRAIRAVDVAAGDAHLRVPGEELEQDVDCLGTGEGVGVQEIDEVGALAARQGREALVDAIGEATVALALDEGDTFTPAALRDLRGDAFCRSVPGRVVDDGDVGLLPVAELAHQRREGVQRHVGRLVIDEDRLQQHRSRLPGVAGPGSNSRSRRTRSARRSEALAGLAPSPPGGLAAAGWQGAEPGGGPSCRQLRPGSAGIPSGFRASGRYATSGRTTGGPDAAAAVAPARRR